VIPCPNCGHTDLGYGQSEGFVICSECDCGDPTNMVGPHVVRIAKPEKKEDADVD